MNYPEASSVGRLTAFLFDERPAGIRRPPGKFWPPLCRGRLGSRGIPQARGTEPMTEGEAERFPLLDTT